MLSMSFRAAASLAALTLFAAAVAAEETKPAAAAPKSVAAMMDDPKGAGVVSSGVTLPTAPAITGNRAKPVASWGKPLPYPVVIADRRNNRLIEISPAKKVVWEFPTPNLTIYSGNEDVNFSPDGTQLAVSEEDNYDLHIVDYEKRALVWTYGTPEKPGSKPGFLNYPDDAHLLADGIFMTADIRNRRVLFIDPKTSKIVTQWGNGIRRHNPPKELASPNGATPMENGDILVSEIGDSWISRITREGKVVWSVQAPKVKYVSDAFPAKDDLVIVADFSKPGRVVIFDPATRKVKWEYYVTSGEKALDHPSIARELPDTGDIFVVDDLRHRVVVIDRQTKEIIWQYGVTDKPGHEPGYLFYPDGFDLDVFRDWKSVPAAH